MAKNSKEKILNAAIDMIALKGRHGITMEEVAGHAGINKAMVYYYYSDRDNLYNAVIKKVFSQMFSTILTEIDKISLLEADPAEKIKMLSNLYLNTFEKNPDYVRITLEAITSKGEDFKEILKAMIKENAGFIPEKFMDIFDEGVSNGVFRKFEFEQFMSAFMAMHVGFYAIRPVFQIMMNIPEDQLSEFQEKRHESIPDLILNGILERR